MVRKRQCFWVIHQWRLLHPGLSSQQTDLTMECHTGAVLPNTVDTLTVNYSLWRMFLIPMNQTLAGNYVTAHTLNINAALTLALSWKNLTKLCLFALFFLHNIVSCSSLCTFLTGLSRFRREEIEQIPFLPLPPWPFLGSLMTPSRSVAHADHQTVIKLWHAKILRQQIYLMWVFGFR